MLFKNKMDRNFKCKCFNFLDIQKKKVCVLSLTLFLCSFTSANCQLYSRQEEIFAYKVKQIDEFIERFNDEGTLIKDYVFNEYDLLEIKRKDLILSLFDLKNKGFKQDEVNQFLDCVNDPEKPVRLSFFDDDWYARVKCVVEYENREEELNMLLRIQKEKDGASKWVVHQVYADFLRVPEGNNPKAFLNPVSHATDFMGLNRAFEDPENLKAYLSSSFQDDQLSKFAMEMQNDKITFQHVEDISYHFFQVDGWIFKVENFQRPDKNSGWLISSLVQANKQDKEVYRQNLLREKL